MRARPSTDQTHTHKPPRNSRNEVVAGRREEDTPAARLGQIPGLGRTSQEKRLDQYQTPGVQVTRDLIRCP